MPIHCQGQGFLIFGSISILLPLGYFITGMVGTLIHFDPRYTPTFSNQDYTAVNGTGTASIAAFSYYDSFKLLNTTIANVSKRVTYASPAASPLSFATCDYSVYSRVDALQLGSTGWHATAGDTYDLHPPHCGLFNLYRGCLIMLALLWPASMVYTFLVVVLSQPSEVPHPTTVQTDALGTDDPHGMPADIDQPSEPSGAASDMRSQLIQSDPGDRPQRSSLCAPREQQPVTAARSAASARTVWKGAVILSALTLLAGALSVIGGAAWAYGGGFVDGRPTALMPVLAGLQGLQWLVTAALLFFSRREMMKRFSEWSLADPEINTSLWYPWC